MILCPFRFGEVDEVLDGLEEFRFRYRSCSVLLAENLEWSIAIVRQVIAAIRLPVSGRYHQRCRKIICETDAVHGVVSSCARIRCRYLLAESPAVLVEKILFENLGRSFGLVFFRIHLRQKIYPQFVEIIIQLFVIRELLLQRLELRVEIPLVFHVAAADCIKLIFKPDNLHYILVCRLICKSSSQ